MKSFFAIILSLFILVTAKASTENEFITDHINEFYELNKTVIEFENILLNIDNKENALKHIDKYSLAIEKSLLVYAKYKSSSNDLISEISTDLSTMLNDILHNNYELLGKLTKSDFNQSNLKNECKLLVQKNNYIANFFRDVSIGICMTTVKDRPQKAKENQQYSKLTKSERNNINKLLVEKLGDGIKKTSKENTNTPFEYSLVAIFEFLNMEWIFEKE